MNLLLPTRPHPKVYITTSWDDGNVYDIKLAKLLKKYNIPATFYIPIENIERLCMNESQIKFINRYFDIGGHSYRHIDLTKINIDTAKKEIYLGKKRLENILNKNLYSFCYPKGKWNKEIIEILKNVGFIGARTIDLFNVEIKNPYLYGPTIEVYDHNLLYLFKQLIKSKNLYMYKFLLHMYEKNKIFRSSINWYNLSLLTLKYVLNYGGIWHLYGHSWQVEKENNWFQLEKLFQTLKELYGFPNVVFLDNTTLIKKYLY